MNTNFKFCPFCSHSLRWRKIDGCLRQICFRCGWIHYKNPLPVAVGVAIDKEGKILLAKRNVEPGKNKWALPGGFVEWEEDPREACLRELREETKIEGEIANLIGVYIQKTKKYGTILAIAYLVRVSKDRIFVNNELKEARFFRKKEIPYIPFSSHRRILKDVERLKSLEF